MTFPKEVGLLELDGKWQSLDKIRILMGAEMTQRTGKALLEAVTKLAADKLDQSIEANKSPNPFLKGVPAILEALKSGKIECRVDALKDRSYKIVVADSSKESCFRQVCFMVCKNNLLRSFNLSKEQQFALLQYIETNLEKLDKVSLRTAVKLAQLIVINTDDWQSMADSGLLNESDE